MSNKEKCLKLISIIEQDYYDSLPYFYKGLHEILLDFIYTFENNKNEEDEEDYISLLPKDTKVITVKAKYVGRVKPKPYYLEDDY